MALFILPASLFPARAAPKGAGGPHLFHSAPQSREAHSPSAAALLGVARIAGAR
jgi:hypothetical protein